jgi:hypothetical protein
MGFNYVVFEGLGRFGCAWPEADVEATDFEMITALPE